MALKPQRISSQRQSDNSVPRSPKNSCRVVGIHLPELAVFDSALDDFCGELEQRRTSLSQPLSQCFGFRDPQVAMLKENQRLEVLGLAKKIVGVGFGQLQ